MAQDERALYIISVAAELAGVHPQTLRIYERKGLIEPARTVGRSRRYSDRDIALLRRIQELTNEGVGLAGVQRILELEDAIGRLTEELDDARREAREAVERVHRTLPPRPRPLPRERRADSAAAEARRPRERTSRPRSGLGRSERPPERTVDRGPAIALRRSSESRRVVRS